MLPSALLLLLQLSLQAQPGPSPLARVTGRGVQIYTCSAEGKWTFTAPEADLFLMDKKVGSHGAGPLWTWNDGSSLSGTPVTSTPAPDPTRDIPALELRATPQAGKTGFLTPATRVTRTETHGGVAPADACDAMHSGTVRRVPYQATYTFWLQ